MYILSTYGITQAEPALSAPPTPSLPLTGTNQAAWFCGVTHLRRSQPEVHPTPNSRTTTKTQKPGRGPIAPVASWHRSLLSKHQAEFPERLTGAPIHYPSFWRGNLPRAPTRRAPRTHTLPQALLFLRHASPASGKHHLLPRAGYAPRKATGKAPPPLGSTPRVPTSPFSPLSPAASTALLHPDPQPLPSNSAVSPPPLPPAAHFLRPCLQSTLPTPQTRPRHTFKPSVQPHLLRARGPAARPRRVPKASLPSRSSAVSPPSPRLRPHPHPATWRKPPEWSTSAALR